jgi:hypothetical protein
MLFKTLIIINLALIVLSLIAGMIFLARDNGQKNRMVSSLTTRVILSITLLLLLVLGYFTGQITPHGVIPQP